MTVPLHFEERRSCLTNCSSNAVRSRPTIPHRMLTNDRTSFGTSQKSGARISALQQHAYDGLRLVRILDLSGGEPVSAARIEAAVHSAAGGSGFPAPASPKAIKAFVHHAVQWMRFLGRFEEPALLRHPHAAKVDTWVDWMLQECGLSVKTVRCRRQAADAFFDGLALNGIALSGITSADIDRVFATWHAERRFARSTRHHYAQCLSVSFRFAEDRLRCRPGLAAAIVPPRVYRNTDVPPRVLPATMFCALWPPPRVTGRPTFATAPS